ncbi:MAG: phosphatidylserine decarboxylase family protein [Bacteroidota bacterium]|nr:phosphatidylserine decarboxylase family protein [Bacteroidota bacterium]
MITKYGLSIFIQSFIILVVIIICAIVFVDELLIRAVIICISILLMLFVVNFFRDPERALPNDDNTIVSPADGKVVLIKELFESEYLQGNAIQVSIFMSPLDVHVNRFPISGVVGYFKHIQGKHSVAFHDKSSELNERTHIGIDDHGYKVFFKQIAGTVARRIITEISIGQKAIRGKRFGMIRFGSRMDVMMPRGTEIKVKLNDRVKAGETILAQRLTTAKEILS